MPDILTVVCVGADAGIFPSIKPLFQKCGCGAIDAAESGFLVYGSMEGLEDGIRKIEEYCAPFNAGAAALKDFANHLTACLHPVHRGPKIVRMAHGRRLDWSSPVLWGILNVTDDSFFDGGRYSASDAAVQQAEQLAAEGVRVIDIGGESSRPGASPVPAEIEAGRVVPLIDRIAKNIDVALSVDTVKASVAQAALQAGAHIVNDISALRADERMAETVAESGAAVVLMHMQGTPSDMQKLPSYRHVIAEITDFLDDRIGFALESGIAADRIIIDPGIGFGKTADHNLEITRFLPAFRKWNLPILYGASRKSVIGSVLGSPDAPLPAAERLYGTLGLHAAACFLGADMLRVHDALPHSQMLKIWSAVKGEPFRTEI